VAKRQNTETFFSIADRVGTFLFANFIWVVLSMTIIGIPVATIGIFAMMNRIIQGQQPEFFRVFLGAIRDHWRKVLIIAALDIAVGGLVFINYNIFLIMGLDNFIAILSMTMTICVTVILIMVNIYVWSYMSLLDLSARNLIKLSLIFGLSYPFTSLGITTMFLLPFVITIFLPIAFLIFITVSASAYIGARGAWYVLNKHFDEGDLDQLMYDSNVVL